MLIIRWFNCDVQSQNYFLNSVAAALKWREREKWPKFFLFNNNNHPNWTSKAYLHAQRRPQCTKDHALTDTHTHVSANRWQWQTWTKCMEDDKRAEWTEQFAWLFLKEVDSEASNVDTVRTERGREFYSVSPKSSVHGEGAYAEFLPSDVWHKEERARQADPSDWVGS